ncbi:MAG: hypothetical protein IJR38_07480 [Selenomonadaceae bacterium]|nr:hypothetical protein [Selenomonadaceae bacterium]
MGSNLTQKEINMLYDAIRNSIPDGAGSVMRDKLLEFLDTAEEFSSRLNAIEWIPHSARIYMPRGRRLRPHGRKSCPMKNAR